MIDPVFLIYFFAQTEDMQKYFPTNLLVTASDILYVWVARMVMMSQVLTSQHPFSEVQLYVLQLLQGLCKKKLIPVQPFLMFIIFHTFQEQYLLWLHKNCQILIFNFDRVGAKCCGTSVQAILIDKH